VGPFAEPDSEQEKMREMGSDTPLHAPFDHRYLTRLELSRCVAAVLAHTPSLPVSTLCPFGSV
jgi:hypothetical protein